VPEPELMKKAQRDSLEKKRRCAPCERPQSRRTAIVVMPPTGQQIWRDDTDRVVSPPTVSDNTLYCGSAYGCIALDAATGKDKWGFKAGNCVEYPQHCLVAQFTAVACLGTEERIGELKMA
jgi:outer membrane protein assembly factor BamB